MLISIKCGGYLLVVSMYSLDSLIYVVTNVMQILFDRISAIVSTF